MALLGATVAYLQNELGSGRTLRQDGRPFNFANSLALVWLLILQKGYSLVLKENSTQILFMTLRFVQKIEK